MELSRIKIFLVALSLGIFNNSSASRITDENVHDMVFEWSLRSPHNISHSFISIWNVSMVTDLSELFAFNDNFNQELNIWDTSRVTSFHKLFSHASIFNTDLDMWDTSMVSVMSKIFDFAFIFNKPLNMWDTSRVTDFHSSFAYAYAFNCDLSSWNVGLVTNMSEMFSSAYSFNKNLNEWDVSSIIDMSSLFRYASNFNEALSEWTTSGVINMDGLFFHATNFGSNLKFWDTSQVVFMSRMFTRTQFSSDLNSWDTKRVIDFTGMFADATAFNQVLCWDISADAIGTENMFDNSEGMLCKTTKLDEGKFYMRMFIIASVFCVVSFTYFISTVFGNQKNRVGPVLEYFDEVLANPDVKKKVLQRIFKAKRFSRFFVLNTKLQNGFPVTEQDLKNDELFPVSTFKCTICLETCIYGSEVIASNVCSHVFHHECLIDWLVQNDTCPVCPMKMYSQPELVGALLLYFPDLAKRNEDVEGNTNTDVGNKDIDV